MKKQRAKMIVCPRCGLKSLPGSTQCDDCGLVFERLELATNKDAKRKIKRGDRDFIIRTSKLPSDVKYWKLILVWVLTGLVGGHNYYVGRYLRGAIFSCFFVLIVVCLILNPILASSAWMEVIGALLIGPFGLVWLFDLVMIILKKFKVPVAIDLQSQDMDEFLKSRQ